MSLYSRLFSKNKSKRLSGSSARGWFGKKPSQNLSMGTPNKSSSKPKSSKKTRLGVRSTGKIAVSIALLVTLATAITLLKLQWQTHREIRDIRIKGSDMVSMDEMYPRLEHLMGLHPDSVTSEDVLGSIEDLAAIKSAQYWVDPAGSLVVDIEDRTAIGLWLDGTIPKLVSADGVFLPYKESITQTYPLVVGFQAKDITSDRIKPSSFHTLGSFLDMAQRHPTVWSSISEVGHHPTEGIIALSHEAGVKLIFGTSNLETALEKWTEFYTKEALKRGMQTFHTIDLRYAGQIVVKENPDYLQTQFIPNRSGGSS